MLLKEVLCDYPIQFLQDNLHGIMSGDMIMLAAGTGTGKSTLSRIFTQAAIKQGQPVVLYSLEDEPGTYATDLVYRQYVKTAFEPLDLRSWMVDFTKHREKYKTECAKAAEISLQTSENGLPLVSVHEMENPNWTLKKITDSIQAEVDLGYKLFILDHMDILVPSERPADMVNAINALWRFVAEKQIALITFSQLASNRNKESLCPCLDDLRGSKAKVHTPTIVLSIARHRYGFYSDHKGSATYCRILKNRQGGDTKAAVVFYDRGQYLLDYVDVDCNESGTQIDGETQKTLMKRQATK
jgi:replicative DNA helicase